MNILLTIRELWPIAGAIMRRKTQLYEGKMIRPRNNNDDNHVLEILFGGLIEF